MFRERHRIILKIDRAQFIKVFQHPQRDSNPCRHLERVELKRDTLWRGLIKTPLRPTTGSRNVTWALYGH